MSLTEVFGEFRSVTLDVLLLEINCVNCVNLDTKLTGYGMVMQDRKDSVGAYTLRINAGSFNNSFD